MIFILRYEKQNAFINIALNVLNHIVAGNFHVYTEKIVTCKLSLYQIIFEKWLYQHGFFTATKTFTLAKIQLWNFNLVVSKTSPVNNLFILSNMHWQLRAWRKK